jgi:hypothetical protein
MVLAVRVGLLVNSDNSQGDWKKIILRLLLGLNFHIEAEFYFSIFLCSLNSLGNIRNIIASVP